MSDIKKLLDIMATLRDPQRGCPWDLEQSFATIVPHTLEEAYEVADVIERDALHELPDELGDLLFQVVFYAQLGSEAGLFTFDDVTAAICEKMIRRHPHVFAADERGDAAGQLRRWEDIKAAERGAQVASALDSVPVGLPALTRAQKIGKKAGRVGFDWPDQTGVARKVAEECDEFVAAAADADPDAMADELGDILFSVVQLGRHSGIDTEQALRAATRKFERRFRRMEADNEQPLAEMSDSALEAAWQRAKQAD